MNDEVRNPEEDFESDKQLEDYVAELDSLKIEPEPSPEATQTLETVVEAPIKNEKKKPKPQPVEVKPTLSPIQPPVQAPPTPQVPQTKTVLEVQPIQAPAPVQDALPKEQPSSVTEQPQPIMQAPFSIDTWIRQTGRAVGNDAENNFLNSAYTNIMAVATGQAVIVPVQQQVPEPVVEQPPQVNVAEELRKLDIAMKDPTLSRNMKAFTRRKCELLGVPFDESMFQEPIPPAPVHIAAPVDSKMVKNGTPKKEKGKLSLKVTLAMGALCAVIGVAIVVLITALGH